MLDKLPFKKEYLLPAGIIIMLWVSYQFAFTKTIAAWQLNRQLNAQLTAASDPSVQPAYLVRKNANLSRILGLYRSDTAGFRSNAINQIAEVAQHENVKLSAVPFSDPVFHTGQFVIQKIQLEGDYYGLERAFARLEKIEGIGKVRSAGYRMLTNISADKQDRQLTLEIYLETTAKIETP